MAIASKELWGLFDGWVKSGGTGTDFALRVLADACEEAGLTLVANYCRGPWCVNCLAKVDGEFYGTHEACRNTMGGFGQITFNPKALPDAIRDCLTYGEIRANVVRDR